MTLKARWRNSQKRRVRLRLQLRHPTTVAEVGMSSIATTRRARRRHTGRVKELDSFALRSAEELKWDQAITQLQQAMTLCGQCAQIGVLRNNIGLIYARKGDAEHARRELQIALRLLPNGPDSV